MTVGYVRDVAHGDEPRKNYLQILQFPLFFFFCFFHLTVLDLGPTHSVLINPVFRH